MISRVGASCISATPGKESSPPRGGQPDVHFPGQRDRRGAETRVTTNSAPRGNDYKPCGSLVIHPTCGLHDKWRPWNRLADAPRPTVSGTGSASSRAHKDRPWDGLVGAL